MNPGNFLPSWPLAMQITRYYLQDSMHVLVARCLIYSRDGFYCGRVYAVIPWSEEELWRGYRSVFDLLFNLGGNTVYCSTMGMEQLGGEINLRTENVSVS